MQKPGGTSVHPVFATARRERRRHGFSGFPPGSPLKVAAHHAGDAFTCRGNALAQFQRIGLHIPDAVSYTHLDVYKRQVHGGIPGSFNIHNTGNNSGFPAFSHNRPEEHSFVLDIHHDFGKGLENFFWDCRVQYTFRWMTGWWFTNTLGYRYDVNKSTSVIVAGTWNATAGYFDSNSLNANGTQGISLTVSTPVKATNCLLYTSRCV